jgi:hypothetical protein
MTIADCYLNQYTYIRVRLIGWRLAITRGF